MPIQNKTITIQGNSVALASVTLYPQPGGGTVVVAVGATVDAQGNAVPLEAAHVTVPAGVGAVDNLLARALRELRLANGLET